MWWSRCLGGLSQKGPRPISGLPSVGGLSKGSYPVFTRVSENTTENSERPGRQALPRFEPGISRLPVRTHTRTTTGGGQIIGESRKIPFMADIRQFQQLTQSHEILRVFQQQYPILTTYIVFKINFIT